jgi:hypothetical protein
VISEQDSRTWRQRKDAQLVQGISVIPTDEVEAEREEEVAAEDAANER